MKLLWERLHIFPGCTVLQYWDLDLAVDMEQFITATVTANLQYSSCTCRVQSLCSVSGNQSYSRINFE